MHADLINILASKRLVTWRPDISEKGLGSASQTDITFQWNFELKTSGKEDGKTKIVRKCSPDFVHFFFRFSPNFPNVKTGTVSITGRQMFARTLRKVKTTFCSNESLLRKMCRSAARLLRQLILHLLWQCPRNISYDISCVCVCVSAAIYRLVPSLDTRISKHKLTEMPQQGRFVWMTPLDSCKSNGWDGETELLSSHAPARPQTARFKTVQHVETPRSGKD